MSSDSSNKQTKVNYMNIFFKIIYNYLHAKMLKDEQAFRNKRLAVRNRLNGGFYTKAGH
jgi:hypothetical protein